MASDPADRLLPMTPQQIAAVESLASQIRAALAADDAGRAEVKALLGPFLAGLRPPEVRHLDVAVSAGPEPSTVVVTLTARDALGAETIRAMRAAVEG